MENQIRRQDPKEWTVGIRNASTGEMAGTGFVVSADGKIVTCLHVVRTAGVDPLDAGDREVGVYFSQARGTAEDRRAKVLCRLQDCTDDVVLLQLTDGPPPLGREAVPKLGTAKNSIHHQFECFGFCSVGNGQTTSGQGTIVDTQPRGPGSTLAADKVQLESSQVDRGMSGAAVLDTEDNLVVGIVQSTVEPGKSTKHRDTAFAVDACVLGRAPFGLQLRDKPLDLEPGPLPFSMEEPPEDNKQLGLWLNNAPPVLATWVGRNDLLRKIAADWMSPEHRVTGLIGFAGYGKTTLARKLVDDLVKSSGPFHPDGVFWWGFSDPPDVEGFLEAALDFVRHGSESAQYDVPLSADAKADTVAGMLHTGHYLFVLDGLDQVQYQEGSQFGLLTSAPLREFLTYFASPYHDSFCLFTSRMTAMDLRPSSTYTAREVDRLSTSEARELLRRLNVRGTDEQLDELVNRWEGHPWTLDLLANHLVRQWGGDARYADRIAMPLENELVHDQVHRLLDCYDNHLSSEEKAFLTICGAFRLPIDEAAFDHVFRADMGTDSLNAPLARLDGVSFDGLVQRLAESRLLRRSEKGARYSVQKLVQAHYADDLQSKDKDTVRALHGRIKSYYLQSANEAPERPTLDSLSPLIEAVHHACRAEQYEEAYNIYWNDISRGETRVLRHVLGANETMLALASGFFAGGDFSREPEVRDPAKRSDFLNEIGLALMNLGRLQEVRDFYVRSNAVDARCRNDWAEISIGLQNLTVLDISLGHLNDGKYVAETALACAHEAGDPVQEKDSLACTAWIEHLTGDLKDECAGFLGPECVREQVGADILHMYTGRLLWYAEHLIRTGRLEAARQLLGADQAACEEHCWPDRISKCHRLLGDLCSALNDNDEARSHYDSAVWFARQPSKQDVLIEALLARGRWYARRVRNAQAAFSDLNEALGHAISSGYRICEADIRVALAWAQTLAGDPDKAETSARYAKLMSGQMGYYWGGVDADAVTEALHGGRF